MKAEKTYELLNSEGPILTLLKVQGHWHWKFRNATTLRVTTPFEVIEFLCGGEVLQSTNEQESFYWFEFPLSMKAITEENLRSLIEMMLQEEIKNIKNDHEYFYKNYYDRS